MRKDNDIISSVRTGKNSEIYRGILELAAKFGYLTNTKIFLRVNDPETASLFSDSLGTYETVEITKQIQLGGAPNRKSKLMGSQKLIEKYRIHPSEIKDLKTGEAVVKTPREHGKISLCPYFLNLSREDVELPLKSKEVENINKGGQNGRADQ